FADQLLTVLREVVEIDFLARPVVVAAATVLRVAVQGALLVGCLVLPPEHSLGVLDVKRPRSDHDAQDVRHLDNHVNHEAGHLNLIGKVGVQKVTDLLGLQFAFLAVPVHSPALAYAVTPVKHPVTGEPVFLYLIEGWFTIGHQPLKSLSERSVNLLDTSSPRMTLMCRAHP